MAYVIGTILIIIALIIVGLIIRKRIYDEVDRLEAWKMDIINRDTASQIAKIKNLNLSGETLDKFESWKGRWETIVTKELPDIEEHLFDAEEAADRYRFSKAKKVLRSVEETLQSIEDEIEKILKELDQLMKSEETSRMEAENLQPEVKTLRKKLYQNRYQFGKAEAQLDKEIDGLENDFNYYHELADEGDYSAAREVMEGIVPAFEALKERIDEFPAILKKCRHELPAQLDELQRGLTGMKEDGYRVEHLGFEKELHTYQRELANCVESLSDGRTAAAKELIKELEERMTEMYQLLEKEAIAKNYVDAKLPNYQHKLESLESKFEVTKEEVEALQQAYYFEDSDMEKYLSLEKSIKQLRNHLEELMAEDGQSVAHSQLRNDLEEAFQQVEMLQEKHEDFKKLIENIRKDEFEAREKLSAMREELHKVHRKLQKSNIPGVPESIWDKMESAFEKNNGVLKVLEKQPLDMTEVQYALSEAQDAVEYVSEQTDTMLDQAYLTEQVIQYANRYRSQNPSLAAKLSESERLFRSYQYELALEQAAKAIEEIEPGALKRIEEYQTVTS